MALCYAISACYGRPFLQRDRHRHFPNDGTTSSALTLEQNVPENIGLYQG